MEGKKDRIYSLAISVISTATGLEDSSLFAPRCAELYDYFWNNPDDIIRDDGVSFHVGTAFYFYARSINNQETEKYRFAALVSFLNLYRTLMAQNMQSCIAAHRLQLLITSDTQFFPVSLMETMYKVRQLLDENSDNVFDKIETLKSFINFFLSQFIIGAGAVELLTQDEQKAFKVYFDTIAVEIKKCSPDIKRQNIIKGNKVMNALCEDFQEKIDMIRFLGAI